MTKIGSMSRAPTPPVDPNGAVAAARNDASRDGGGFASHLSKLDLDTVSKEPSADDHSERGAGDSETGAKSATSLSTLLAAFNGEAKASDAASVVSNAPVTTASTPTALAATASLQKALNTGVRQATMVASTAKSAVVPTAIPGSTSKPVAPQGASTTVTSASSNSASDMVASLLSSAKGQHDPEAAEKSASVKTIRPSRPPNASAMPAASGQVQSTDLTGSAQAAMVVLANAFSAATNKVAAAPQTSTQSGTAPSPLRQQMAAAAAITQAASPAVALTDSLDAIAPVSGDQNQAFDLATNSEESAHEIKMNVSSVQAETHLIPVQHAPPSQQIADLLGASLPSVNQAATNPDGSTADSSAVGASVTIASAAPAVSSPVKILTLTLEPDTLGSVTITMRLVDSGLNLQVGVAKPETATLIERDKDKISDKLQALGYAIDGLDVKTVASQRSESNASSNQPAQNAPGQQAAQDAGTSGASQNGSGSRNDRSSADGRHEPGQSSKQDDAADVSHRNSGDGLYV